MMTQEQIENLETLELLELTENLAKAWYARSNRTGYQRDNGRIVDNNQFATGNTHIMASGLNGGVVISHAGDADEAGMDETNICIEQARLCGAAATDLLTFRDGHGM